MTKTYKPNIKAISIVLGIPILLLIVVALMDLSIVSSSVKGIAIFLVVVIVLVWLISTITIKISNNTLLEYSYFLFIKKRVDIKNIYQIDRVSSYNGLGPLFGYQMLVYYETDGQKGVIAIGETVFEKKVIKSFINDLISINFNIKLDKHYLSFVKDNKNLSMDDENGNCKQCGHPFDPHLLIADDAKNPVKGIIKCPVAHCPCHSTWDLESNNKLK